MKKLLSFAVIAVFIVAFAAGCGKTNTTSTDTKLKDGTYKATYSHLDGHGWKPQLEMVVEKGKITKATFDYVNAEGKLKTQDEAYNTKMKEIAKTSPKEYAPKFGESLVKVQDVEKVEAVAGATHSLDNFKALAKAAMEAAAKGETKEIVLAMNDTYTATEKDFDERGWKASVSITYENDKIVKVVYDEENKDKKKKSEDAEYNANMKAKSGISAKEAAEKLASTYASTQKVDTVAGATGTTARFKALVEQAAAMRK